MYIYRHVHTQTHTTHTNSHKHTHTYTHTYTHLHTFIQANLCAGARPTASGGTWRAPALDEQVFFTYSRSLLPIY